MSDKKRASALTLARMGLPVFKLRPRGKKPVQKAFYDKASADPTVVEGWWTDEDGLAEDFNVGVLTGNRLSDGRQLHIIDIDNKDDRPKGWSTLDEFESMGLDTDTFTVQTPTGGRHLYYGCPPEWPQLGNTAGSTRTGLGPGVDTRGFHGYVVGPGSEVPEGVYHVIHDAPIATLPDWMLQHLRARREVDVAAGERFVEDDDPFQVSRAIEHVQAYGIPPEGKRNQHMFTLSKDMLGFGLSHGTAESIMLEHWPLLADASLHEEFLKTCRSAYENIDRPIGMKTAAFDFEDVSAELDPLAIQPAKVVERINVDRIKRRFALESITALRSLPPLQWLVGGWFPEGGVGIIYGRWGSGKSFLVFDLAMHLATGKQEWHGSALPGVPCPVLIIASEGKDGFIQRIDAFKTMYGITEDPTNLMFMRESVNFMNDAEFKALLEVIAESKIQFRMVMIDTVGRTLPGADSNTAEAISTFMDRCRRLGAVTGATTIGVHHENKAGGMLGSIVFQNDSDFVFHATKKGPDGPLSEVELHCEKMKEGKDGWSRNATFVEVHVGDRVSLVIDNLGTTNVPPTGVASASTRSRAKGGRPSKPIPLDKMRGYLAKMQQAFDAAKPWNDAPASKKAGRHIARRTVTLLGLSSMGRANDLVDGWIDIGIIGKVLRDSDTKQTGYRPLFDIETCLEKLGETYGDD